MIRAELRLSSDGVQLVAPIYDGKRLLNIVAGPADMVVGALPGQGVDIADVIGMTDEFRQLWGVRKEPLFQLDNSRQLERGGDQ